MDMPSSWLSELEMQDQGFMNHYQMNKSYHNLMEDFSVNSFSSDSYTETTSFNDQAFQTHQYLEVPDHIKQPFNYRNSDNTSKKLHTTAKPFTISFGDVQPKDEFLSFGNSFSMKNVPTHNRNPIQVQDHVLAERKRREKLAQRFVSLSTLLPDLKKMDKATVLEDAANYIEELQNRVKELEGSSSTRRTKIQESVITGKRSRLSSNTDDGSSSYEANFEENSSHCNPEIEVRTSECNLLVEIYSRKNNISLVNVLSEMQKVGLSIISCSTLPFVDTTLLVTIVAQKSDDFILTPPDLVKNLQLVV